MQFHKANKKNFAASKSFYITIAHKLAFQIYEEIH